MDVPGAEAGPLDVVSVGELVVDLISVEQTGTLGNATTFRRYLGGSPANIAVYVSRLGGTAAVISKTGIGAFGKFLKSQLGRHGVEGYVERMIDREALYKRLEIPAERRA
jgi:sugar/nucleoside kinase (ribokinase family)